MPDDLTCHQCYWFKLRWAHDGHGVCWKTQTHRFATDATCEHYEARVIFVDREEIERDRTDVER